jgi:ABC-2 type transport system permease protein
MTATLVRKLLRDVRPALLVVCLVLFAFATLWVKIAQRVTSEIAPVFNSVALVFGDKNLFQDLIFKGPGRVSQAALGWGDLNFERPDDFLAMGILHPVVLILALVWSIGRAGGAIAGEIERGTMELLLSQPLPRNRLILAHFLVDLLVLPLICSAYFAGTQFGLYLVGDFVPDYTTLRNLKAPSGQAIALPIPDDPQPLPVNGLAEFWGLLNTVALMFAVSGMTLAISAVGRSRWRTVGYAVLIVVVMFVANTLGQLWEPAAFTRPVTLFFYYQPQKAMLQGNWLTDLGQAWPGAPAVPGVAVLVAVGILGYLSAWRTFVRRDLPAPL